MKRRPPSSTLADTLFPHTTLCRAAEAAYRGLLGEEAGVEGWAVDVVVGGLAAVSWVGEHVVDAEGAAGHDVGCPALVVESGRLSPVAAVDEEEREGCGPRRGPGRRVAHHCHDGALEPRLVARLADDRQRVHLPARGVDEAGPRRT